MSILKLTGPLSIAFALSTALTPIAWAQDTKTIKIATHYNEEQMAPLTACFRDYEAKNPGVKIPATITLGHGF